ncbi:MAG: phosphoribosylformylglycinamidine synthase subunit PurQ [Candidatus Kapabacteria bacterium]|nr:phosphoribosylformylglycinamidine synthase subunit PurQ [Candidatus Kapabacteria bacterium]
MKFGVVVFPGSNCDHDAYYASSVNAGYDVEYLWHKDSSIPSDIDCIILPGGFSYGDYLRCGAIARFSPIMNEVIRFANNGKYVIGICNGFQILTESGLLPGTLLKNNNLKFICKDVYLKVENTYTKFTKEYKSNEVIRIPIAHGEGNYFAEESVISELENNNRVIFRYTGADGNFDVAANPNGSVNDIAGIISAGGNVLGMMPHPERYSDNILGCSDGIRIFISIANNLN